MSEETKSLTASDVARIVAISASKGTGKVFKAIAYLFATASIVFAIGLVWVMYEAVDEETGERYPYDIIQNGQTRIFQN